MARSGKAIDTVLDEFLAEQQARWGHTTYRKYESVVALLKAYMERYLRTQWAEHKRSYAVLHRFDASGNHLGTDAWSGGTTADGEEEACGRACRKLAELLGSLGECQPGDICVKPFRFEQDGYLFGLLYKRHSHDDPDKPDAGYECVMLWPNDVMFHRPWDSGEYST
jgi:formate hydrogenlyase regulatory protein HycA